MNADAFRHFYQYHFAENRRLWESYVDQLSSDQFTQPFSYSIGSVREQMIHLHRADEIWFCELRGVEPDDPLPETAVDDRPAIRARRDQVEQMMRRYLDALQDSDLLTRPIQDPAEDRGLAVLQVLLHVANHGTDHRAQLLRQLNDLGLNTISQDYIFFVYDNL